MKKILLPLLVIIFLGGISYAANRVIIDGVEKEGTVVTITTVPSPPPPPPVTYSVTVLIVNPAGGTVSPMGRSGIVSGGSATFTVAANSGYVASVSVGSLSANIWTISNVTTDLTVTVTFNIQSTSCDPPSWAEELKLDYRYTFTFAPGEKIFFVRILDAGITRIKGQVIGLSGDTDVVGTWIMPSCKEFYAYASGTDNGAILDIRSRHAVQPNIVDEYVPVGNHTFKIKANTQSSVIIWFTTYQ